MSFVRIDPGSRSSKENYFFMISAIVPRPIAWVTSTGENGVTNAAPFSYFNGVTSKPPTLSLCIGHRRVDGNMVEKDTLRNIRTTREFVVNVSIVSEAENINQSAAEFPEDQSEIDALQLETLPSDCVAPPRIAASPVQLECKLDRIVMVGEPPLTGLVLGQIVRMHVDDSIWDEQASAIDVSRWQPLARLGGADYGTLGSVFSLTRPDWKRSRKA